MYPAPNDILASKLNKISIGLSFVVLLLVGLMRRVKIDLGIDFSFLPPISAMLNTLVAICLVLALYFVKRKDIVNHKRSIYSALIFFCFIFGLLCIVSFYNSRDYLL
jgi:putative membrane protein